MKRLSFSGVLLAWAACTTSQPEAPTDVGRPNVLFVFYDQYRPDIIGAYGGGQNITTPNLDRLAREGMLFTNALSTTPVCTPLSRHAHNRTLPDAYGDPSRTMR